MPRSIIEQKTISNKVSLETIVNGDTVVYEAITATNDGSGNIITSTYQNVEDKGENDGYAPLDSNGKIPRAHLTDGVRVLKGTFGSAESTTGGDLPASEPTPPLVGDTYICDTDAYDSTEAGNIIFDSGDFAIWDSFSAWVKIDNTDSVVSVNDKTGIVVLGKGDVGLADADNTSDANKPISTATSTALGDKEDSDNKSSNIIADKADPDKYPSTVAVYNYINPIQRTNAEYHTHNGTFQATTQTNFYRTSEDTSLFNGRKESLIFENFTIISGPVQYSIEGDVPANYKPVINFDGTPVNLTSQLVVGKFFNMVYDLNRGSWVATGSEADFGIITGGVVWEGDSISDVAIVNDVQNARLTTLEGLAATAGANVLQETKRLGDVAVSTQTLTKLVFDTVSIASNDISIISADVNNDTVIEVGGEAAEPGFQFTANAEVLGTAGGQNTSSLTFYLFDASEPSKILGNELDRFTVTVLDSTTADRSKTITLSPDMYLSPFTTEVWYALDNNNTATILEFKYSVISLFSSTATASGATTFTTSVSDPTIETVTPLTGEVTQQDANEEFTIFHKAHVIAIDNIETKTDLITISEARDLDDMITENAITVTGVGTVGALSDGDIIDSGTTLEQLVNRLLRLRVPPTYVAPTGTLTDTLSFYQEIGTIISNTLTPTFTQNDGGSQSAYELKRGSTIINSTFGQYIDSGYVVPSGTTLWTSTVDYVQGPILNDNYGDPDPTGRIEAGSTIDTTNISGARKAFYTDDTGTVAPTNSAEVRALPDFKLPVNNNTTWDINVDAGTTRIVVAYPYSKSGDISEIYYIEVLSDITSNFVKTQFTVEGADSEAGELYNIYTYIPAVPFGSAATFRVTI